jgi:glutathione S-transferase
MLLAHAALVERHLADGRSWRLGGDQPTFSDITLATAIAFFKFPVNAAPLDKRFEHTDAFWRRWQTRPAFPPPMPTCGAAFRNSIPP